MALGEGLSSSFSVTLGEQILRNQSLDMASVSRDSLNSDFVGGTGNPVLSVFTPVTEDLLVDSVLRSLVAIDCRGKSSRGS